MLHARQVGFLFLISIVSILKLASYPMVNAFRTVSGFCGRRTGSRFYSSSNRIRAETSVCRRHAASVAVIAAVSSATALAAQGDGHDWRLHGSRNLTTAFCEETTLETDTTDAVFPETLLKYDHYNGVIVHLDWILQHPNKTEEASLDEESERQQIFQKWTSNPQEFEQVLETSLRKWRAEGRKGIWVHLPRSMASVVPACIKLGFDFHSCQTHNRINAGSETGSTSLILSQWLPTDVKSRLPLGPYFQAGVGCVVLHPKDSSKMLVVQEITGPAAARKLWKMPTGLIDPGEDIGEAALRELEEETGLKGATCEGILAFRQAHGASAGRAASDFFFVCLLSIPSTDDDANQLDNLKPQEHEIKDIQWMSVQKYADQDVWQASPTYKKLNQAILDAVENQKQGKPASSLIASEQLTVGFMPGLNTLYKSKL
ncbi:Nudix hydrolase [Seminavis robusta]|uniref:Nudix hydrolase n=1 Tax=Seminavis robusta TaxID=568900 RepID=A0A9N8DMR1_9STRA|nr:Nudix hydrolase [Seminavis robusta]|eukprot:Sro233_g094100.1 Nudix hydrolase (430) ;mRNA; r:3769-5262